MNPLSLELSNWLTILLIVAGGILSYIFGKLTLQASFVGIGIAILIYLGAGFPGISMLAAFFILGTAATAYKREYKQKVNLAEIGESKRTSGQVFANAGIAALFSMLIILFNDLQTTFQILIAACLASATSDTLSSELGNVFGKRFFNIQTLKPDKRGLNGVISLEGTFFGLAGSATIAVIYCIYLEWSALFFVILFAGLAGNLFDSLLGAMFERSGKITNNAVNFLNTSFAALIALLLMLLKQ